MWIPKEIDRLSTRLKEGRRIHRITVRDLLRMFKAERRGLNKVHDIRTALDSLGLETDPDFESECIDARIRIRLKTGTNGASTDQAAAVAPAHEAAAVVHEASDEEQDEAEGEAEQLDSGKVVLPPIVISSEGEGVVETKLSEPPD